MKGIAPLAILLILIGITGTAALVSVVYPPTATPSTNSTDPAQIAVHAARTAPLAGIWNAIAGGISAASRWLVDDLIMPLMGVVATFFSGHSIGFPPWLGYVILSIIAVWIFWKKKDSLYDFFTKLFLWLLISLAVVAVLAIALRLLGAI